MGAAKNGEPGGCRPQATGTEPDDAVDDADDVLRLFAAIPQWLGSLLGSVKYYHHCNAVFCYRVGSSDAGNGYQESYQGQEVQETYRSGGKRTGRRGYWR